MKRTKEVLKTYFETGDQPTQNQYEDLIDSLRHEDDGKVIKLYEEVEGRPTITLSDDTQISLQQTTTTTSGIAERESFSPEISSGRASYGVEGIGVSYKTGNRVDFSIVYTGLALEEGTTESLYIYGLPTFGRNIIDVDQTLFQVQLEGFQDQISGLETNYDLSDAYAGVTTIGQEVLYINVKANNRYVTMPKLSAVNGTIRVRGTYYLTSGSDGR